MGDGGAEGTLPGFFSRPPTEGGGAVDADSLRSLRVRVPRRKGVPGGTQKRGKKYLMMLFRTAHLLVEGVELSAPLWTGARPTVHTRMPVFVGQGPLRTNQDEIQPNRRLERMVRAF